jgi:hypothetical protein
MHTRSKQDYETQGQYSLPGHRPSNREASILIASARKNIAVTGFFKVSVQISRIARYLYNTEVY